MNLSLILLNIILISSVSTLKQNLLRKFNATQSRIIGGQLVNPGDYSWTAAIYVTTADGNYFCTGAVFSQEWIITAGQCADGAILFTIVLGTTKLEGNPDAVKVATDTYVLHPQYNPNTLDHNVALIKLRQAITYSTYLNRIYLPFSALFDESLAFATGWGQTSDEESGIVNDLYWVRLTVLSNLECQLYYGSQITDSMVCAIGNYNEGTCIGDTGGPLMQQVRMNYWVLVGIASFISSEGCESPHPSGYTRIWGYMEWIGNVTEGV